MFALTNYLKGKVDSDHNTMIARFSLAVEIEKTTAMREEHFNFKNEEAQKLFFENTEDAPELIKCFENDEENVLDQGSKWFKQLNRTFHKSFKKIRITKKPKDDPTTELIENRRELLNKLKVGEDSVENETKIFEKEKKIEAEIADENKKKIMENFSSLTIADRLMNVNGMWNLKRKTFPKNKETLPFAKKDMFGNIITAQSQLNHLYLERFSQRLRKRPIKDDYKSLKTLKERLCEERLKLARLTRSEPWSLGNLMNVLKALKKEQI